MPNSVASGATSPAHKATVAYPREANGSHAPQEGGPPRHWATRLALNNLPSAAVRMCLCMSDPSISSVTSSCV